MGVEKRKQKQPAHYEEKVEKEPGNDIEEEQVLSIKKIKRKIVHDNVPAPSASKAIRGRSRQFSQGKSVMENVTENIIGSISEIMVENADEIVDGMKGNSKRNVGGVYSKKRQATPKRKGKMKLLELL